MRRLLPLMPLLLLLAPLEGAREKRKCPEFCFSLPGGEEVNLERYRGKVVVVEVMLTTCPSCKRCAQTIETLYRELAGRGLQPVAVAMNDGAEQQIAAYRKVVGLTYPVGYADRMAVLRLLRHPVQEPVFVPQLVFIDRAGMIRAKYAGTDYFFRDEKANIRKLVEELLSERPPASSAGGAASRSEVLRARL